MQSRRQFILRGAKLVAAGAAAVSAGPTVFVRGAGAADKQLKILQWAHFVPAYDKWFDPWAMRSPKSDAFMCSASVWSTL